MSKLQYVDHQAYDRLQWPHSSTAKKARGSPNEQPPPRQQTGVLVIAGCKAGRASHHTVAESEKRIGVYELIGSPAMLY